MNAIGSSLYLAAVLMLEDAGLSVDDVEFVATGSAATTMAAWRSGAVDVQLTFAPVPELLETLGVGRSIMVTADQGPAALRFEGLYGGWVTTGSFIDNRKSSADAFILAMQEAIDWIRNPDNAVEMTELAQKCAGVSVLSPEENQVVIARMVEDYRRFWGYQISNEAIQLWNDYALRFGLIEQRVPFGQVIYDGAPTCTSACR